MDKQAKIEKESCMNVAAYVDDASKFADDVDAVYESKKKVRKPPARKDNSKIVNGVLEWNEQS